MRMAANGSASPRLGKRSRDDVEGADKAAAPNANGDGNSGIQDILFIQLIATRFIF